MRKWIIVLLIVVFGVALATKPDDKTCIIEGVRTVWGPLTPDPADKPDFFEDFMNLHSPDVRVKDWIFFKQVMYNLTGTERTVAYGAFKNVIPTVRPIENPTYIPRMPDKK